MLCQFKCISVRYLIIITKSGRLDTVSTLVNILGEGYCYFYVHTATAVLRNKGLLAKSDFPYCLHFSISHPCLI